jgi:hypothetical protein
VKKVFPVLFRLTLLLNGVACFHVRSESPDPVAYDWGPFAASWTDVHGNQRTRVLGPIYDKTRSPEEWESRAIRPFYHRWGHEESEVVRKEILWPLGTYRQREDAAYWRFLLTYRWNWDVTDPDSRHRTWIFPIYFQGRTAKGENYLAVFPFGGTIKDAPFWDQISFVLFPLFVESKINDIHSRSWLWPIISKTKGAGVRRFRIFPFYGYNEREGRGRKTFILWPIWNQVKYTYPESSGFGWILFPIAGHLKLTDQETWWFIPPIFRYTKGQEQSRLFGPWPFLQTEKGEDKNKFYLWPLYGRKQMEGVDNRFFLWPLGKYEKIEQGTGTKTRTHLLPFYRHYTSEPSEKLKDTEMSTSWTKVWPLYSHLSKGDGEIRKTVFPDFNPMRGGPIERNYAPFWQLYVRQQVQEDVDKEILWGMYRSLKRGEEYQYRSLFPLFSWSREAEGGHFTLLKGLLSKKRFGEKNQWRVLYLFKFGGKDN